MPQVFRGFFLGGDLISLSIQIPGKSRRKSPVFPNWCSSSYIQDPPVPSRRNPLFCSIQIPTETPALTILEAFGVWGRFA